MWGCGTYVPPIPEYVMFAPTFNVHFLLTSCMHQGAVQSGTGCWDGHPVADADQIGPISADSP